MFKLENLVVLRFCLCLPNVEVIDALKILNTDKEFSMDIEKGLWRYNFSNGLNGSVIQGIDNPRLFFPPEYEYGVIGVFDKTQSGYLYALEIAITEAMKVFYSSKKES